MAVGVTLRLVRHGETDWSAERRYTGRTDVTLNEAGIAQARALTVIAGDRYDSVWCSSLTRCVETARLMGVTADPTPHLQEFDFGEIEGLTWDELDSTAQNGLLDFNRFIAPGGESVTLFGRRIDAFVEGLGPGRHLLITHGGVIRYLLRQSGTDADVRPGTWRDIEFP